ncbi:MAG: viperin family antiviral radical SAM protein [Methanomassiliicoccaceae archaeon]|nr:viperin family antiviral radical SAM protein [Methanomassiliicoccaceae archaeon]
MAGKGIIKSANIHVTGICNYRCKFCFAKSFSRKIMTPEQWRPYLTLLKEKKITKINVVGGEPFLYPHLMELCKLIKSMGFVVSVVTNGSRIDRELVKRMVGIVDWIGLSVDSPDEGVEKVVGRHASDVNHIENVIKVANLIHKHGIKVKLNITVIRQSCEQDFSDLIRMVNPERVKVLQVLKIEGENEDYYKDYSISKRQWKRFVRMHENIVLKSGGDIVFEGGKDMIDSYLIVDPLGRIVRDTGNKRSLNEFSIISMGGLEAVVNVNKYAKRRGLYNWGLCNE